MRVAQRLIHRDLRCPRDVRNGAGTESERPLEQPGVPAAFQQEAPEPFQRRSGMGRRAGRRAVPAGGSIDP